MKVTRTDKSPTQVVLVISADQFDLTTIKDHTLTHFADKVNVPGFRSGTAPAALVEKYVNHNALADEFIEHALNQLYGKAIDQEKLRPASKPEVKVKKFIPYTELEFEAELEVIGPIKLGDYKKIKAAKKPVDISAKEVEDVVKSLQSRAAERKAVDRAAKVGDELIIDFKGKGKDGMPIPNTAGKDIDVILGSYKFVPGFEDNLVGLKAGDQKEFEITFPKDYGVKTMQSKPVTFSVEVKKVNEVNEPATDDAFAAKIGSFKTLAELKADIKKQLLTEKQQQADRDYENEIVNSLIDKSEVTVPKAMVDEQIAAAEEQEKRNLMARGQTWGEHLAEEGVSEEQHRERQRPDTERRVKGGLILSEVAEQEDVAITQEELQLRIQRLKSQYQDEKMQAELDNPDNQRQIAAQLMTEKTVAKLVDYVTSQ
ncbi:TPA: trigger factor [Candidatus Saccharibacteria bacterium]|nr:MAG: Trigger factor [Candidatus Saccharibacteria bacterium GW2011_GWA2_46_10]OGL36180.1 MAG: trigger factor [Candidatus Saccharibacteria bacterium RIFCSPHIGHO2_12_FULL_47_17]HCM51610.1 trigger factor [Candidatus Saccharibacteria bacterium]